MLLWRICRCLDTCRPIPSLRNHDGLQKHLEDDPSTEEEERDS